MTSGYWTTFPEDLLGLSVDFQSNEEYSPTFRRK